VFWYNHTWKEVSVVGSNYGKTKNGSHDEQALQSRLRVHEVQRQDKGWRGESNGRESEVQEVRLLRAAAEVEGAENVRILFALRGSRELRIEQQTKRSKTR